MGGDLLRSRRAARGAASALAVVAMLSACRAVIGYRTLAYESADGGDAGCPAPPRSLLFTSGTPLGGLVLSGSYVYAEIDNEFPGIEPDAAVFVGPYSGLLVCAKAGCDAASLVVDDTMNLAGPAFGSAATDDAGLYVAALRGLLTSDAGIGAIESADLDGSNLKVTGPDAGYPLYVAATGGNVYWTDDPVGVGLYNSAVPWSVKSVSAHGPFHPTTLFEGFSYEITSALFTDSRNVYVVAGDESGLGGLFSCPLLAGGAGGCGGQANEIVSGLTYDSDGYAVDSFTADGVAVYRAGQVTGAITRYDLGTTAAVPLAQGQASPANIAVDATSLYWSTDSGVILHMPKDGSGRPVPLVCGLSNVEAIAVDAERVYFVAAGKEGLTYVESVPVP